MEMTVASMVDQSSLAIDDVLSRGIICLSTIDWDFLWQRQQELMTRFARAGVPVLFVEPLGIRSARASDAGKIARRVRRWLARGLYSLERLEPGLYRLSPYAIPVQGHARVDALNRWLVARLIQRACNDIGMRRPVLWTYYATRVVSGLASALKPQALVYDCIDDVAHNPKGVVRDYTLTEQQLLSQADLVLTTSTALYEDKYRHNANTHLVPPGVNAEHFAVPVAEASDLIGLPHPRLGFFGGIDERLDFGLLASLARRRPDWTLLLVGVVRTDISPLAGLSNIVVIGQRPYADLPSYVQHVDILLLPYLVNEYTKRIYPAKVYECLATAKPVLATPLADLQSLSTQIRLLLPGEDPVAVVEKVLAEDTPVLADQRRALARANSWDARFQEIWDLLFQTIAGKGD